MFGVHPRHVIAGGIFSGALGLTLLLGNPGWGLLFVSVATVIWGIAEAIIKRLDDEDTALQAKNAETQAARINKNSPYNR